MTIVVGAVVVPAVTVDLTVLINGIDAKVDELVIAIVVPAVVVAVVNAFEVNSAEVVTEFHGVVVSTEASKSSASKTCLGRKYDSTVISSASPRDTASELVDKSLVCMFSMNSVEFALRTILSTVSIIVTDDNIPGRSMTYANSTMILPWVRERSFTSILASVSSKYSD